MTEFVTLIKQASVEANSAGKPVQIEYGKVISASPLKIQINQKLTLGKTQLVLCRNVTDYTVPTAMTLSIGSESYSHTHKDKESGTESLTTDTHTHTHSITGGTSITINNALKVGEKVIMIRQQEGQKYLVLDRVVDA